MHRVRAKLYPNYLPGGEGTFIAKTDSETTINVEQTCAAMCELGTHPAGPCRYLSVVLPVKLKGALKSSRPDRAAPRLMFPPQE